jgi:hypothetical protein
VDGVTIETDTLRDKAEILGPLGRPWIMYGVGSTQLIFVAIAAKARDLAFGLHG